MYQLLKIIINLTLRCFLGLKIEGRENIPKSGGFILLFERGGFLECLALVAVMPAKIYWAVSGLRSKHPFLNWFLLKLGCFPLDTDVPDVEGFRLAFEVLKMQGIIAFYPPRLTKGIALFYMRSGKEILPAVCLKKQTRPFLKVLFGPKYNFREYQNAIVNVEIVEGLIQQAKQSIEDLVKK